MRRIIYRVKDRNLVRTTTLANNENVVLSEEILLSNIDKFQIYFGDSLDDMTDIYPGISVAENLSFPQFVVLNYEINERAFSQVMGFFR